MPTMSRDQIEAIHQQLVGPYLHLKNQVQNNEQALAAQKEELLRQEGALRYFEQQLAAMPSDKPEAPQAPASIEGANDPLAPEV